MPAWPAFPQGPREAAPARIPRTGSRHEHLADRPSAPPLFLNPPLQDDVDAGEEARDDGLKVQEVDAYWLQRRIAKALGPSVDAPKAQALAEQVRPRWPGLRAAAPEH